MAGEDNLNVLVIDDEPMMLSLFETVLSNKGYGVKTTTDGFQGIELVKQGDVDVVISDIKMPSISGIEVLKAVRESVEDVGFVLMTGYATVETTIEALHLGVDDYLLKPFENFEETVLRVVNRVGEKRRLIKENRRLTGELNDANQRLKRSNTDLKRMVARISTLQQTNQMINGCSDEESILEVVGDGLSSGFDISGFVITIANENGWYEPVRWHGFQSWEAASYGFRFGEGNLGSAIASGIPSIVEMQASEDSENSKVMAFPLIASGETTGALIITCYDDEKGISQDALGLFSVIAAQMSAPLALARIKSQVPRQT